MRRTVEMIAATLFVLAIPMARTAACAGEWVGLRDNDLRYEFFEPYGQRIEGITQSAGNAKDVNAVTHMIDPWPRGVMNRRIPANGERMAGAVQRYRQGRLQFGPPPISPVYRTTDVTSVAQPSGGGGGGGTGTTTTSGQ